MASKEQKLISSPEQFINFFSHELKTPLTGLSAFTQLLLRYLVDTKDSKGLEYATRISKQTEKLTELVDEILDIARLNAGTVVLNDESCDIGQVMQEIFTIEKVQILPQHSVFVTVDTARLERFLAALSPYTHHVTVDESIVTISVQDFPLRTVPEALEEIYQLDGKDKKIIGLKLFLTQKILQLQKIALYMEGDNICIKFSQ